MGGVTAEVTAIPGWRDRLLVALVILQVALAVLRVALAVLHIALCTDSRETHRDERNRSSCVWTPHVYDAPSMVTAPRVFVIWNSTTSSEEGSSTITNDSFAQIFETEQDSGLTLSVAANGRDTPEPDDDDEDRVYVEEATMNAPVEAAVHPSWDEPTPSLLQAYHGTARNNQLIVSELTALRGLPGTPMSNVVNLHAGKGACYSEGQTDLNEALLEAHMATVVHYKISDMEHASDTAVARRTLTESVEQESSEPAHVTLQESERPTMRFRRKKNLPPKKGTVLYKAGPALCKRRENQIKAKDRLRQVMDSGLITNTDTAYRAMVLFNRWIESTLHQPAGSVYCTDCIWRSRLSWISNTIFDYIDSGTTDFDG